MPCRNSRGNRALFPSLKRRGGCALTKKREATEMAQPGWSVRRDITECVLKTFAELTTPAASLRNGNFLLMSRPPLLFKEGKKRNTQFSSSKMANLQSRASARVPL